MKMKNEKYMEAKKRYLSEFERFQNSLNGEKAADANKLRLSAFNKFKLLDFPTKKNEDWKDTNVSPILSRNFAPVTFKDEVNDNIEIEDYVFKNFDSNLLVFINGLYSVKHSNIIEKNDNIFIGRLSEFATEFPEKFENYFNSNLNNQTVFGVLNSAYSIDGAIIYLKKNTVLENLLQVLYLNGEGKEDILIQPKNLIVAEEGSQAKVIINYNGTESGKYFTNAVTQIILGENSIVDVYKIENENSTAFHIEDTLINQEKGSVLTHFSLAVGASLTRNDLSSVLQGENIESNLYGLFLTNGTRHVDNHTFVDHTKPNCYSNELYRGILDDDSHGVFRGKIMVREDAQKTNAYQSNKNLLLSEKAGIDTKPQLEIYADDVKCSHGATIGAIDKEAYFYIRSRGIPENIAQSMLIKAFAEDVVEPIKIKELKSDINNLVFKTLHREEL